MRKLDVIVPTYNNQNLLTNMVNSMTRIGFFEKGDRRLIIVNNGKQPCGKDYAHIFATGNLFIINNDDNLGWEGGLKEGLKHSDSQYICFQNDDVHIPQSQVDFYDRLIGGGDDRCGMIGPITTCAAGIQSIYHQFTPIEITEVRWLIFMCVMMRREVLDAVGGVDDTLRGGDDFDLSIRMRLAGYKLFVNPHTFLVHHGFQTGQRVHGGPDKDGGWNSLSMQERTNKGLIQKHGFRTFFETIQKQTL